jgi:2,4-dienoyl-CoA reductase-like NADH-dependent reductase (Old Yellow Enzyme family)
MAMADYPHLFSPLRVGHMTVPNRIVSTAHQGRMHDGTPGDRHIRYHLAKIVGGVGMDVVFAIVSVHPSSPTASDQAVPGWNDDCIAPFQRVTSALRGPGTGAALICQITHRGRRMRSDSGDWLPALSPSAHSDDLYRGVPHVLDDEDVEWLVEAFAATAARVRAGGFDGVEVLAAYTHLVDQFWSPLDNWRQGTYGGDLAGRMRFSLRVLAAIRTVVGRNFIVGLKITGDDMLDGGIDPPMACAIARTLAESGHVDYLNVIGATNGNRISRALSVPGIEQPHAVYAHLAQMIKREVAIPVIATGRIVTPGEAESVIASGKADLVSMTRALLADPDLPRKAQSGRTDQIRTCTGCNEGCIGRNYEGQSVICIQNPVIGREAQLDALAPADRPARVVVVGGGVAGMEAARVAALRGHRVVLFEAGAQLGGQVLLAARAPHREEYVGNARWLERQIAQLERVEVRLNRPAGVEDVLALEPDAVILATGARPARPALPGLDGPRVQDAEAVFAQITGRVGDRPPLLAGLPERAHVVVVDEEGYVKGMGVGDLLASMGCRVEFVTSQYMPGQQLPDMVRAPILRRCYGNRVRFHPNLVLCGMRGTSVLCRQFFAEDELEIENVDLLVLAYPPRVDDALARVLKGKVAQLRTVGDCVAPRGVASAILEGTLAGRAV